MTDEYERKTRILGEEARKKYKKSKRFYFWEWVPSYGYRQIGRMDGYPSLTELKRDCEWSIKNQKSRGLPVFIMEAKVIQVM